MGGLALGEGRRGRNIRHHLPGLLRQAVYGRLAGYEDVNDAERLARDPVMRAIVGREDMERPAASTSQMGRFETEWLASEANLAALTDLSGAWIDRVHERRPPDGIILDMDSSESPTHGQQEGSAWNGHFGCTCYHPLFVFNQFGDLERCVLRPGNAHSAEGWRSVLEPVIARYRERRLPLWFRGDAAFAKPELYEMLEAEAIGYAIRLPANSVLQERIGHLLTRPVGRPPTKPQVFFASFSYQAQSWASPHRVVAKVEWHQGELYPRVGFIVTNLTRPAERVSKFYNGRGTAEQWIREGKYPGEHAGIIDQRTWDKAHAVMAEPAHRRGAATRAQVPALLKGLIFGPNGRPMSPSHTRRRGRIYRYYVTREAIADGYESCEVTSVPAADVEGAVLNHVRKLLAAPELVARTWAVAKQEGDEITEREITVLLADFAMVWNELFPAEQARIVQLLVERVDVQEDALEVRIRATGLASLVAELRQQDERKAA